MWKIILYTSTASYSAEAVPNLEDYIKHLYSMDCAVLQNNK